MWQIQHMAPARIPNGYSVSHLKQLPIYQKAVEIYALSRNVTNYLSNDKDLSSLYRSSLQSDKDMEEIVITALGLPMQVAEAQTTGDFKKRLHIQETISKAIETIRHRCKALRKSHSKNADYLRLFSKELAHFKRMHLQWSALISQKN